MEGEKGPVELSSRGRLIVEVKIKGFLVEALEPPALEDSGDSGGLESSSGLECGGGGGGDVDIGKGMLMWTGRKGNCQFEVTPPGNARSGLHTGKVTVTGVGGEIKAKFAFRLRVQENLIGGHVVPNGIVNSDVSVNGTILSVLAVSMEGTYSGATNIRDVEDQERILDEELRKPVDVVLSYATRSSDPAMPKGGERMMQSLVEELRGWGFTTFDGSEVPPGGNWRNWWGTKALNCGVVLPLLSPAYFDSPACIAELTLAANAGKAILPVLSERFPSGTVPVDCKMILQDKNRIPSSRAYSAVIDGTKLRLTLMSMLTKSANSSLGPSIGSIVRTHTGATEAITRPASDSFEEPQGVREQVGCRGEPHDHGQNDGHVGDLDLC